MDICLIILKKTPLNNHGSQELKKFENKIYQHYQTHPETT